MLAKILRSLSPLAFAAAALTLIAPAPLVAQTAAPSLVPNRLTQPVDENSRITLASLLLAPCNPTFLRGGCRMGVVLAGSVLAGGVKEDAVGV